LAVLAELVVGCLFVVGADHGHVGLAGAVHLGIALVEQVQGIALGLGIAVDQQAVRERAHAQVQLIQNLDARYVVLLDDLACLADVAHLDQQKDAEAEHQQANQREAK